MISQEVGLDNTGVSKKGGPKESPKKSKKIPAEVQKLSATA